jgi:hypothetical protein
VRRPLGVVQQVDAGVLATLVFERQKTGDIVQGLPRVEELLEGRKPKESAILAEADGVAEIEVDDDVVSLYLVNENGRSEIKYTIDSNIIVVDKQKIKKGFQKMLSSQRLLQRLRSFSSILKRPLRLQENAS